jgi:hypothetical protein
MKHPFVTTVVLVAVCAAACSGIGARVRRYTYPPDFNYISERQLDSAMWRMASEVRRLDEALRDPNLSEPQRQATVVNALDGMAAAASAINTDRRVSNHPLLDHHLPQVRDDISLARDAAAAVPPRYALAGAVAGACVYCHVPRVATTAAPSS